MRSCCWPIAILLGLSLILLPRIGWPDTIGQKFVDGISAYKAQRYKEAIGAFKSLADSGIVNAKLYYNLGNAYFKANDIGHAILWYQRALKLDGDDPDLRFNLSRARSFTKDADDSKAPSLYRILFFWKYQLNHHTIVVLAILCNTLFWLLLLIKVSIRTSINHLGYVAAAMALPAVLFISTALYNYYDDVQNPKAIILPERVSVRSGLGEHATELFLLHAGTVVTIERVENAFFRISYSANKVGWVKQSEAGVI